MVGVASAGRHLLQNRKEAACPFHLGLRTSLTKRKWSPVCHIVTSKGSSETRISESERGCIFCLKNDDLRWSGITSVVAIFWRIIKIQHDHFFYKKNRGRPWRYSVIPSTPDFQTEYQIYRNSNPAGLTVFTAISGPDFRASIIILTHMLKQIKQIIFNLMTMFKVTTSPPNEVTLICTQ